MPENKPLVERVDEETKAKVIDAVLSEVEIENLVESGEVQIGKPWINNCYGYRRQLFLKAIAKLYREHCHGEQGS